MNWLWRNFWLKVVGFTLALMVWVHVATEKVYNYEFSLPVTEIMLQDGLALSQPPPEVMIVSATASGKQLLRRRWRQEGLRINATQYQAGRFNVGLSTQNISLVYQSADVALDEIITPTSTRLEIDLEASTELPVSAALETIADDGFAVGREILIEPATATLIGPRSRLQSVKRLFTKPWHLGSLRNSVTVTLPLDTPEGYGFRVDPDSVSVTVSVFPVKTRIFKDVPVLVFNAPGGVLPRTEPELLRIEVTAPPADIDQLDPNSLTLSVDYREQDSSGMAVVKFDCPPGFRLRSISSDSVLIIDPVLDVNPGD
jgi:YbbR domain-containing protein